MALARLLKPAWLGAPVHGQVHDLSLLEAEGVVGEQTDLIFDLGACLGFQVQRGPSASTKGPF